MRYINCKIRIADVARKLDLRLDGSSKIHCWHSDRHQNGDRTASVGIRGANNTLKCFGCGLGPIGPIDLAMDVLGMSSPRGRSPLDCKSLLSPLHSSAPAHTDTRQVISRWI